MNQILEWAPYILSAFLLLWLARNIFVGISNWKEVKRKAWDNVAQSMHKKGKNYDLLVFSEERLIREPNDPTALYWKAIAEKEMNFDDNPRITIGLLLENAPSWKEDWMNQYLEYK
jgi:hypothetical protein